MFLNTIHFHVIHSVNMVTVFVHTINVMKAKIDLHYQINE